MKRIVLAAGAIALTTLIVTAQGVRDDAFTVRRTPPPPGPQITPYLRYQVDQAWRFDKLREETFGAVRIESDFLPLQNSLRYCLLSMIGGLPGEKVALNARIMGTIRRTGYRIEKLIFESLPGFHVTAHLYLPDPPPGPKPAVLVPCGHSQNGKIHYQYVCSRLARLGYVALCWDPVGQGERSQFWDAGAKRSRYNLVCGEHAVLGNLAYLAGANIARWEIWDGIRALDYLLTRPEVDAGRIAITGTSGGGVQAALLGALDARIGIVMPSCYISALPMRMSNRIFKDPDSDPEQDLYGMVSEGIDHAGLMLLTYPRPSFVAAAVEDFFPIEGTRKTMREVRDLYRRLGRGDRTGLVEGYHAHQYSPGNILAAVNFMNRFNGLPAVEALPPEEKLPDTELLCTRTGQVLLDHPDGRPLVELIRQHYLSRKGEPAPTIDGLYNGRGYPGIRQWPVAAYDGVIPDGRIAWQSQGSARLDGYDIDRYLLHHSEHLSIPLLHIRQAGSTDKKGLLWFTLAGKAAASDWPQVRALASGGRQILTFDFRGLGEDRMRYTAASIDDPALARQEFDRAYVSPISGVLANYVYNSLLTGRPYFLQMIEDAEIVARFSREKLGVESLEVAGARDAFTLAAAMARSLPGVKLLPQEGARLISWREIVETKLEQWPIQFLLPGGAYIRLEAP